MEDLPPAAANLPIIGWREWIALPELGVKRVKAKVDSGAKTSSLHVSKLIEFERDGKPWVRFRIHPFQKRREKFKTVETPVVDVRSVRSSSGQASIRPVIATRIVLLGQAWPVELTLADRSQMGFRMLLGREAFRGRFLVDVAGSFYGGIPLPPQNFEPET